MKGDAPAPATPITTNQNTITGPNNDPMRWVPRAWITNSAARITADRGTTRLASPGSESSRPSTDESTEMAGVITESP